MKQFKISSVAQMQQLGRQLGARLQAGDLLILSGNLGAGKTTLTQGIGEGLGVRGPITSPTFVISREHPSLGSGPRLVHVDAYRLNNLAEVDDLDLDSQLLDSVVVAEWGIGKLENLNDNYIFIEIESPTDNDRVVSLKGSNARLDSIVSSLEVGNTK